jgi:hypothetical protein
VRVEIGPVEGPMHQTSYYGTPVDAARFFRELADDIDKMPFLPSDEEIDQMLLKRYGKTAQQLADEAEAGYDLA